MKVFMAILLAIGVAVAITNAIYFGRLYRAIRGNNSTARQNAFSNGLQASLAMWIVNIILAVLFSAFFIFAMASLGNVNMLKENAVPAVEMENNLIV